MRTKYPLDKATIEHDRDAGRLAHCHAHGCVATHNCEKDDACDVSEFEETEEIEDGED